MDKKINVFIHGMGVMGKDFFRAVEEFGNDKIRIVGVDDPHPVASTAALAYGLNFDSVYRNFRRFVVGADSLPVSSDEEIVEYDKGKAPSVGHVRFKDAKTDEERAVPLFKTMDPKELPYEELGVDLVYDASGKNLTKVLANAHLVGGAELVHLSAPPKDEEIQPIIMSVNDNLVNFDGTSIYSGGSCTTTCLSTLIDQLHKTYGIEKGLMTTVHSYTNDQSTHDGWNKSPERGRAAAVGYKTSTTGATETLGKVIPDLAGKLDGLAIRDTHEAVSAVDTVLVLQNNVTAKELNAFYEKVAAGEYGEDLIGRLGVTEEKVTSTDLIGNPHSALVEFGSTHVVGGNLVKLIAHYDNVRMFTLRQVEFIEQKAHPYINRG